MMENVEAKHHAQKAAAHAVNVPTLSHDGVVDVVDKDVNSFLVQSVKKMERSMFKRVAEDKLELGHEHDASLVTAKAKTESSEGMMTSQQRASRWLSNHGMKKMS